MSWKSVFLVFGLYLVIHSGVGFASPLVVTKLTLTDAVTEDEQNGVRVLIKGQVKQAEHEWMETNVEACFLLDAYAACTTSSWPMPLMSSEIELSQFIPYKDLKWPGGAHLTNLKLTAVNLITRTQKGSTTKALAFKGLSETKINIHMPALYQIRLRIDELQLSNELLTHRYEKPNHKPSQTPSIFVIYSDTEGRNQSASCGKNKNCKIKIDTDWLTVTGEDKLTISVAEEVKKVSNHIIVGDLLNAFFGKTQLIEEFSYPADKWLTLNNQDLGDQNLKLIKIRVDKRSMPTQTK